jgi:hypothetical protein
MQESALHTNPSTSYLMSALKKGGSPQGAKPSTDLSQGDKVKAILQEYGKVAILSHSTIWALSLAVTYAGFRAMGMDEIIRMLPERCGHRRSLTTAFFEFSEISDFAPSDSSFHRISDHKIDVFIMCILIADFAVLRRISTHPLVSLSSIGCQFFIIWISIRFL